MRYMTTLLLEGKSATGVAVPPEIRSAAGIAAGDAIELDVVLDDAPRTARTRARRISAVVAELASARQT
ncbi:hypothetical protein BH11ACT1_BH11ACT1_05380 [soil metagenome]